MVWSLLYNRFIIRKNFRKMRIVYYLMGCFLAISCMSQKAGIDKSNSVESNLIDYTEIPAMFPGGDDALQRFIQKELLLVQGRQGKLEGGIVLVIIRLSRNGDVSGYEIVKSPSKEHEKVALKIIKKLPRFIPAKLHGNPVSSKYSIKIDFDED